MTTPDYTKLREVLDAAFQQSASGKGRARHANGRDFDKQPILEIARMVGPGYQVGQAMKKGQEAMGMVARGEYEAAVQEMLGAIVYNAACVVLLAELAVQNKDNRQAQVEQVYHGRTAPPVNVQRPVQPRTPLSDAMRAVEQEVFPKL